MYFKDILNFLMNKESHYDKQSPEFVMEVTDKTRADVKGGTLTQYRGHLRLLELAQVSFLFYLMIIYLNMMRKKEVKIPL